MSQPTTQRPPQVTLASGIVIFSSVVVLLTVWERVTSLGSLETQEAIREVLAESPFSSLDLTVSSTTDLLRIACMVAAVCACATAILGWYVRKPDRSARLGLTVFAVLVFLTGLPAGGLAGSFVAAGAAMLWMQPGREWFATGRWTPPEPSGTKEKDLGRSTDRPDPWGRPPQPPEPPAGGTPDAPGPPPPATRPFGEPPSAQQPGPRPAESPYGQPYPQPSAPSQPQPQPQPQPYAAPTGSWPQHAPVPARPGAMVAAFVITVVTAGGLLGLSVLWLAIAGLSPEFLMSIMEQQQPELVADGLTLQDLRTTVFAVAGAFIVWCVVALTLAGFAMARRAWARRGLMVNAAFSAVACFALVLNAPLVLVPAAAAVATLVCLRRVEVRRWFSFDAR
ncbi:hypothetical protein GCM10011376_01960 [Nocardioides flavus (ex Wang et al. 2016)]|uniref:Uncharacterized protein n=1 Tax=Nocardioides flavus (ex Wang et al. 2016) TaxID=2058780 RepID=A0ABQ3HFM8_9ACTN|nr:hypothetical protein [Nocardioides flavus (ex Wang et al. 2016)]GHE15141.1 hypothetical protein GCM10011376_01960 [Nocardioides flavus (ex Wang et al. 2016)]